MEIYKYVPDTSWKFNYYSSDKEHSSQRKRIHPGDSLKFDWEPMYLTSEGGDCQADFSLINISINLLLFSSRAWLILEPFIGNDAETLPVFSDCDEKLVLINFLATAWVDCLDKENSKINYSDLDGRPVSVKKYVFRKEMIQDRLLFRIPETAHFQTFVTEKFKNLVEQEKLTGLALLRVG